MYLQIIISILVIIALSVIIKRKSQNKLSLGQAATWFLMWLIVLIVFWYPESTSYLASALGIGRGADLIIYAAIVVMFYMLFRIYLRMDKLSSDITKVVRKVGIDEVNKKDNV
ncbi:DUF2304 domain-containing protein [Patescibacteria group bacterium]|nr:DUF2304 domain-containing protein [Patescibacteria group bacterium]